ncbi:hypothetical protein AVEN_94102-1 [Araneus ventricosus]|uniref:Uncharacterized protein n=1 Tax=Araneus ventricosus TaxID=182803 RepID=A0A4Y2PRZ4_ARAVE|nr:hypothetical protein AVEN_94102-1 [Araneus ventricosus]
MMDLSTRFHHSSDYEWLCHGELKFPGLVFFLSQKCQSGTFLILFSLFASIHISIVLSDSRPDARQSRITPKRDATSFIKEIFCSDKRKSSSLSHGSQQFLDEVAVLRGSVRGLEIILTILMLDDQSHLPNRNGAYAGRFVHF